MSANLAIVGAFVMLTMILGTLSAMCQKEIETRIGRVPNAVIRLAASRLPREARDDVADEWRAELDFILCNTEGLPITRLLRGMHYAIGLLRVPPGTARELSGGDETLAGEYGSPAATHVAGVTYRQLDYWARIGLVEPIVRPGTQQLYSFRDILMLKVIKRLLDTGISLQQIRAAAQHLRDHATENLAQVTLMSDGVSIYECTSPDEVVDLLAGGQGVFGIALGRLWLEVEGALAELPESDPRGDD
jgi:DNA-binding transcriptional MerR regulator